MQITLVGILNSIWMIRIHVQYRHLFVSDMDVWIPFQIIRKACTRLVQSQI